MIKISKRRHNKDSRFFSNFLVLMVFLLAIIQVFLANSLSVQGKEISRLNLLGSDLDDEMQFLRQDSSYLSSLETIRKLAYEKLQMTDGFESFDYLSSSVALR